MSSNYKAFLAIAKRLSSKDPAHDFLHVHRVFKNGQAILTEEMEADEEVVLTAILLHEVVNLPKNHPMSSRSGDLSARLADDILIEQNFLPEKRQRVLACIQNHSFSKGVQPETLEEKIVQDADRLDAIGAIGVARCFATCSELERPFYHEADPFATERTLDDQNYGLDHFYKKLLLLGDTMHTEAAKKMAESRINFMKDYLRQLSVEI